jgi:hypothetical protein
MIKCDPKPSFIHSFIGTHFIIQQSQQDDGLMQVGPLEVKLNDDGKYFPNGSRRGGES